MLAYTRSFCITFRFLALDALLDAVAFIKEGLSLALILSGFASCRLGSTLSLAPGFGVLLGSGGTECS